MTTRRRKTMIPVGEAARDCALPGEAVPASEELAYRRGYNQGAWIALNALEEGARFEDVMDWATFALRRWRTLGHPWPADSLVKAMPPPDPPGPEEDQP